MSSPDGEPREAPPRSRNLPKLLTDRDEVLGLAKSLISIESHREAPGRESGVGSHLADWLAERGVATERQDVVDHRFNLVARLPGGSGPSLMLNGHLDTVPAGEMVDAFAPREEDGRLVGRGACDMKGALAAMAGAVVAIRRSGVELAGELVFAATVDEETGSRGVGRLVESESLTDYAVVGEPTSMRLGIAHKGVSFIRIVLQGIAAHGSRPDEGVNAAVHGAKLVPALTELLAPELARRSHPLLGRSTLNVGRICGGSQPNIVADRCEIDVDRRTLPGETDPVAEIERLLAETIGSIEGLQYDVYELPESAAIGHPPLQSPADGPVAQAVLSCADRLALETITTGLTYWTDGAALSAAGVETVIIGPGDIAQAHGPYEWALLDDIAVASELYACAALSLLAPGEDSS